MELGFTFVSPFPFAIELLDGYSSSSSLLFSEKNQRAT